MIYVQWKLETFLLNNNIAYFFYKRSSNFEIIQAKFTETKPTLNFLSCKSHWICIVFFIECLIIIQFCSDKRIIRKIFLFIGKSTCQSSNKFLLHFYSHNYSCLHFYSFFFFFLNWAFWINRLLAFKHSQIANFFHYWGSPPAT